MNEDEDKPWWNDGDKVAGMCTTILVLTGVVVVCMLVVKLVQVILW